MNRAVWKRALARTMVVGTVAMTSMVGVELVPAAGAQTIGAVSTVATSTPYCGIYWGSMDKHDDPMMAVGPVLDVRAGQHDCYDRLVIDQGGKTNHYLVSYVDEVRADGSGAVVPLRGGARLQIVLAAEIITSSPFSPTDRANLVDVAGYQTFRQVASAGAFEGIAGFGLGVRARLPYRVFTLDGPGAGSRLVIDVAHKW